MEGIITDFQTKVNKKSGLKGHQIPNTNSSATKASAFAKATADRLRHEEINYSRSARREIRQDKKKTGVRSQNAEENNSCKKAQKTQKKEGVNCAATKTQRHEVFRHRFTR